jgi:hypothetical protein
MKLRQVIIIVFLLASCFEHLTANGPQTLTNGQFNEDYGKTESFALMTNDSTLIEKKTKHKFSQIDTKDEFSICVKGESLLKGKVIFTITNFDGIEIFKEEFPSLYLIGYDLPQGINAPKKDQDDFIKKRVNEFFDAKNFKTPAIISDEIFDEDYSEKEIWDEIKTDKYAIGFYFLIGEEDGKNIAYSKRLKKVVVYLTCC